MATTYVRSAMARAPASPIASIDDLIKFRLVESLLRQPDSFASAGDLARRLGFHSVEVTAVELDDLVSAGVLRAERRTGQPVRYALVGDPRTRSELADLVAQGPPSLLTRLAAGSVSRIKKLLRKPA
jgi:hypothetical protein